MSVGAGLACTRMEVRALRSRSSSGASPGLREMTKWRIFPLEARMMRKDLGKKP